MATRQEIEEEIARLERARDAYDSSSERTVRQRIRGQALGDYLLEAVAPMYGLPVQWCEEARKRTPEKNQWVWGDAELRGDGFVPERRHGKNIWADRGQLDANALSKRGCALNERELSVVRRGLGRNEDVLRKAGIATERVAEIVQILNAFDSETRHAVTKRR